MTLPPSQAALSEAFGHAPSDKRLEVLRRVGETGSISQAARDAGISYKAAWQAIDTLSNLSGQPLVERTVGGVGGGGARITPQGLQLLAMADELARARQQGTTGLGQRDATADAIEQRGAELLLQRLDALAHGGLGQVQRIGGLREGLVAGNGDEGLQDGGIHRYSNK